MSVVIFQVADAQRVVLGTGVSHAAHHPVGLGMIVEVAEHHRPPRSREERRELVEHIGERGAVELQAAMVAAIRRLPSPSTMSAYLMNPASMAVHARWMAFMNLEAGVAEIEVDARGGEAELVMHGAQATDGSRWCLHTDVEMSMPISDGSMPDSSMALRPATAAA